MDQWCALTGVSRTDLANVLDLDRSEATNVFKGRRRLLYFEAQSWVDYLLERLAPLPQEPVRTIATPPRDNLRKMPVGAAEVIETSATYSSETSIAEVANALTQYYAVMISDNYVPEGIVTRWDYLKLLKP